MHRKRPELMTSNKSMISFNAENTRRGITRYLNNKPISHTRCTNRMFMTLFNKFDYIGISGI